MLLFPIRAVQVCSIATRLDTMQCTWDSTKQGRIQEPARGGAQTGYVVGGNRESQILLLVAAFLKQQIITS